MTPPVATQIIVRSTMLQEARFKDEGVFSEAVEDSAVETAPEDPLEQARLVAAFNNGMGELLEADTGSTVMSTARNGIASRIQSSLVEWAEQNGRLAELRPAAAITAGDQAVALARLLEVQFDSGDWAGYLKMAHYLIFKPKHARWQAPPETPTALADDAVLAVFSDWGTGLYGAPAVSSQIRALPRADVVLHLGDTYYAGRPGEVTSRLVQAWPTRNGHTVHRSLNGNHEMYSGGSGYFAALASAPFQQSSSCVAFQSDHWLLLGLDTSYVDASLDPAQVDWITRMIDRAGARKVVLFSHHQVYSAFDRAGDHLRELLGPLLVQGRIQAWYFGHEHRLVVFEPNPAMGGLKARCMGHGGFPEFRQQLAGSVPDRTQWIAVGATANSPAAQVLDGPNRFIADEATDPVKYAPHGYLVLDFAGADLFETFYDPDGQPTRARERV